MAIKSFKDVTTEGVFQGKRPKGFPTEIVNVTRRKLRMVDAAHELRDLNVPPNSKLHPLKADREGQHAISVNDQSAFVLDGRMETPTTWNLRTTTTDE